MASTTRPTVYKWIARYEQHGIDGLSDRVSTGRPPEVSGEVRAKILALTRQSPPEDSGLSHWSSREMARYLKREMGIHISHSFVAALWREHGLQPHRQGTFKLSTDPDFEEKVIDVVGLYLDPPMDAVVLSIDEKTQIQALDRTQPLLPMTFCKTEKRTHDYTRHGTTNLFAALNTATGEVVGRCFARRRTEEFLKFMDQVVAAQDGQEIHVVLDNLSTHSGSDIDQWLTNTRTSPSTSPQPAAPGSTKWRSGSASSLDRPSGEEPLGRCASSSTPSTPTSQNGTTTQNPSPGPRQRTKSSPGSD